MVKFDTGKKKKDTKMKNGNEIGMKEKEDRKKKGDLRDHKKKEQKKKRRGEKGKNDLDRYNG